MWCDILWHHVRGGEAWDACSDSAVSAFQNVILSSAAEKVSQEFVCWHSQHWSVTHSTVCVLSLWSSEDPMTSPTCILLVLHHLVSNRLNSVVCSMRVCVRAVLFSWSVTSEVCCSVCQTETPKKPFPPPVDQWLYTPVSVAVCFTNECDSDLTDHVVLFVMSETRKTASGIIYTLKSCSESVQLEATPAADCTFTVVTPPPLTVNMTNRKRSQNFSGTTSQMFLRTAELAPGTFWLHFSTVGGWVESRRPSLFSSTVTENKRVFSLLSFEQVKFPQPREPDRIQQSDWWLRRAGLLHTRGGGGGSTDSSVTFSVFGGFLFRQNKSDPQPIFSHFISTSEQTLCSGGAKQEMMSSKQFCRKLLYIQSDYEKIILS